jgi:hypothetical protein
VFKVQSNPRSKRQRSRARPSQVHGSAVDDE